MFNPFAAISFVTAIFEEPEVLIVDHFVDCHFRDTILIALVVLLGNTSVISSCKVPAK